ncbi:hypothetical protein [Microbacterium sp. 1.5R]|uniref:hypothetical protein n=1 Tax=Microbacterium sp. 1.5R TaxID=1916917 RepID=UPI0016436210|nr:hypothetical protein [Microbacterium sp. 1.5R]
MTTSSSDVLWACVEEGFHVGSRAGDFLGYVDRQPSGRFRAFDARSEGLGDFSTLGEATAAVAARSERLDLDGVLADDGLQGTAS